MNDHILIDAYLKGDLTGDELASFEGRMKEDVAFNEEVELQRMANQVIVLKERTRIKEKLNQIHASKKSGNSSGLNKWWVSGLIILAIIALVVYKYKDNGAEESTPSLVELDNSTKAEDTAVNAIRTFDVEKNEIVVEPAATSEPVVRNEQPNTPIENNETIDPLHDEREMVAQPTNDPIEAENHNEGLPEKVEHTEPVVENPCDKVASIKPTFELVKPCFGGKEGTFSLMNSGQEDISFSEYSLDGGKNFHSSLETVDVKIGGYQLLARTDEGCVSKMKAMSVGYADCNFAIQPGQMKFFELEIPMELERETTIEIRSARSGQLVFSQELNPSGTFIWNGTDLAQNQLAMGNYVYWIKSKSKGVIAQGQIAIIR